MKNRLKEIVEAKGITPYRFWKDTGISRDVAYRLVNNPDYIPREQVMESICKAYNLQPGDFLYWEPNEGEFA